MSTHGGRRGPSTGGPPPLAWALLVIAAALVGGLAAAALVHTSLVIAVIVAVVIGGIAVAVFRSPIRPAPERAGSPDARSRPAPPAPAPPPPAAARTAPRGQTDTVVQLLPLQAQPGENSSRPAGQSWWDAAAGAAPPPPSSAAQRAPAPDLSTYMASTFIAQCPRCGAFRLDFRRAPDRWDFRCESCEYVWAWQPGTPWPPVRVMPARRRE
jgi:hypothetical protein